MMEDAQELVLVDSHCHLDDERYEDATTEELLERAAANGVKYAQTICTRRSDFATIHDKALAFERLFCSFGIHPHHAHEDKVTVEEIIANTQKEKVIGIGECGLDYYYMNAPKDKQLKSFEIHLEAAQETGMPVIIHTREAEEDTMKVLDKYLAKKDIKLLFHCFSSSAYLADYGMERGIYISAPGIITFKKSQDLRDVFARVPDDLLLVETDSPYLAPVPHRGKTNEPAYTLHVAECLAETRGQDIHHVAQVTTNNFFKLFNKATR